MFRLIGEGHGTRQIADELHLSVKTVESYQAHIKEKLALQSSRDLVQRAIEWRLANANDPRSEASGIPRYLHTEISLSRMRRARARLRHLPPIPD